MYKIKIKNIYKVFILTLLLFSINTINANFLPTSSFNYELELIIKPENPIANQTISAKANLYALDINKYEILWFLDGKLIQKGIGQTDFFFQTGNWGKETILTAQVNTTNDGIISKQIYIVPTEVDLIWEAETYIPPFYKGKVLNSSNSIINVVAVPNLVDKDGNKIPSDELIYKWKEDWKVKGNQSGYGKNTFSFESPQINQIKSVTVEIESLDNSLKTKKTINFRSNQTKIIFYKKDPLLGTLYNQAISIEYTLNRNEEEVTIKACPFFFSHQSELKYKWEMNNKILNNIKDEVIFRKQTNLTGSTQVSLKINNLDKILQFTDNNFSVNFKE